MADDRRLGKEPQRFLPELEPKSDRCHMLFASCRADSPCRKSLGTPAQVGRGPGQSTPTRAIMTPIMIRLVRHFRCSSANTASMIGIVTIAVRETTTNAMLTMKPSETAPSASAGQHPVRPQQTDDRIGQRHRAQRKLLTLVDVILDEDAATPLGSPGLERKTGIDMRRATTLPSAARRTPGMRRRPTSRATTARNDRTAPAAPAA